MEDRLTELERRLDAAERRTLVAERRLRRVMASALGMGALLGVMACWQTSAIAQAAKTAPLKVTKVTAPLQVVDPSGSVMLMVENARPGARLQLYGSTGRPIAELGMTMQGGGQVTVYDRAGKPTVLKAAGK